MEPPENIPQFEQLSLFMNATLQKQWILSLNSVNKWWGPRIIIKHQEEDSLNTAYYNPGNEFYPPSIHVGPGDNILLKRMRSTPDAVQHEVNHHIVYQRIKIAQQGTPSIAIHEGIADFLVMTKNKNPCFGKNLCVKHQSPCTLTKPLCLRNANKYIYLYQQSSYPIKK